MLALHRKQVSLEPTTSLERQRHSQRSRSTGNSCHRYRTQPRRPLARRPQINSRLAPPQHSDGYPESGASRSTTSVVGEQHTTDKQNSPRTRSKPHTPRGDPKSAPARSPAHSSRPNHHPDHGGSFKGRPEVTQRSSGSRLQGRVNQAVRVVAGYARDTPHDGFLTWSRSQQAETCARRVRA